MLDPQELSLALSPFRAPPGSHPREPVEWARLAGFRSVTLDATAPGLRPRELDRSARRDLAALLRRLELRLAGVELWIPGEHFTDGGSRDRAMGATLGAIDLVAELATLTQGDRVLSVFVPPDAPPEVAHSIAQHALRASVRIANHAPTDEARSSPLDAGLDPAASLLAARDPISDAARLGSRLACARLSDASTISRIEPGSPGGRLDALAYSVALRGAGYSTPVVLDLRAVPSPTQAAARARARWKGLG